MNQPGAALLDVRNLVVNYGAVQAIRDISFDVREGEIVTRRTALTITNRLFLAFQIRRFIQRR